MENDVYFIFTGGGEQSGLWGEASGAKKQVSAVRGGGAAAAARGAQQHESARDRG